MLRTIALIYGMLFLCFAILGFVTCMTPNQILFGLFFVNPTVNILHLLTGVFAIFTGAKSATAAKIFFQIAGFVYALITILGFACKETNLLGILANNLVDTWVNLLIAILSLFFGFYIKKR